MGPSPNECDTRNGLFRHLHLRLNSFQKSVQIAQAFKGKIQLLHFRQQSAKEIVNPQCGRGIISYWNLKLQSWAGQACLLENAVRAARYRSGALAFPRI